MGEAAHSCDGTQIWRLRIESSLFEQTFFWSWTHRSTQLIEICPVMLSPSQSDRTSRTGGCAVVTTDFFPNCVSVFSRKVEASLPGPCPGGPTCKVARKHKQRLIPIWMIHGATSDRESAGWGEPNRYDGRDTRVFSGSLDLNNRRTALLDEVFGRPPVFSALGLVYEI